MDYEKKYKEALELARVAAFNGHQSLMEGIFPELKESEDELAWLKKYIEEEAYFLSMDIRDNEDRIKLKKLQRSLAWLEKQGEKPQRMISAEAKEAMYDKPAWSEDDDWIKTKIMKVLLGSETFLTTEETNECVDWLKSIKQRIGGKL